MVRGPFPCKKILGRSASRVRCPLEWKCDGTLKKGGKCGGARATRREGVSMPASGARRSAQWQQRATRPCACLLCLWLPDNRPAPPLYQSPVLHVPQLRPSSQSERGCTWPTERSEVAPRNTQNLLETTPARWISDQGDPWLATPPPRRQSYPASPSATASSARASLTSASHAPSCRTPLAVRVRAVVQLASFRRPRCRRLSRRLRLSLQPTRRAATTATGAHVYSGKMLRTSESR